MVVVCNNNPDFLHTALILLSTADAPVLSTRIIQPGQVDRNMVFSSKGYIPLYKIQ
jgi:hypothetical protein